MRRSSFVLLAVAGSFAVASTGHAQQVPYTEGLSFQASVAPPALAPDGNSFYVWTRSYDPAGDSSIVGVLHLDFDGQELEPDIKRAVPYFSPDGKYHAFNSSGDDGVYGVNIYDVAAGEYRFLTPVYESNAFLGHRASKNI